MSSILKSSKRTDILILIDIVFIVMMLPTVKTELLHSSLGLNYPRCQLVLNSHNLAHSSLLRVTDKVVTKNNPISVTLHLHLPALPD